MRIPSAIKLHKASKKLSLTYGEQSYELSAEFLRVHSPSAEVQGHGNPVLQVGKLNVGLNNLEPAGQYALKLTFDLSLQLVLRTNLRRALAPGHAICNIPDADCCLRVRRQGTGEMPPL